MPPVAKSTKAWIRTRHTVIASLIPIFLIFAGWWSQREKQQASHEITLDEVKTECQEEVKGHYAISALVSFNGPIVDNPTKVEDTYRWTFYADFDDAFESLSSTKPDWLHVKWECTYHIKERFANGKALR